MERWQAKVLSLVICLVSLFTAVALPIKVSQLFYAQGKKGERWLDIVNCFGGGVFLGTYLVTFPQVRVLIEDAFLKPMNLHYPLPEVLVGAGFFFIMFLEKSISSYNSRSSNKVNKDTDDNGSTNETELKQSDTVVTFVTDLNDSFNTDDYANNIPRNNKHNNDHSDQNGDLGNGLNSTNNLNVNNINIGVHGNTGSNAGGHGDNVRVVSNGHSNLAFVHDANDTGMPDVEKNEHTIEGKTEGLPAVKVTDSNSPDQEHPDFTSALKALILMAALAIDNVFIGMGLGLRNTNIGVWNMLITILSHELVISFTLGLALVKHNTTKKVLILAAVYSSMCPIGIAIGTVLLDTGVVGEGVELVSGVLQALAAGVFLYVTFFEILDGHVGHNSNIPCLLAILAGFILMCLLALLEEDAGEETQMFHPAEASGNSTISPLIHDIHNN